MQYNTNRLNSLSKWRNPVNDIKDPLKQRWAEIVQTMSNRGIVLNTGAFGQHIFSSKAIKKKNYKKKRF